MKSEFSTQKFFLKSSINRSVGSMPIRESAEVISPGNAGLNEMPPLLRIEMGTATISLLACTVEPSFKVTTIGSLP